MGNVKSLARWGIGLGAQGVGLLAVAEVKQRAGLMVLCYHRILPAAQRAGYYDTNLVVTPEAFASHCRLLAARYTVCPFTEALERWHRGERPAKPLAAITFDDGYRDNARHAAPVLAQHGLPATFFIIAGLVGSRSLPWYDAAGRAWNALATRGEQPSNHASAMAAVAWAKQLTALERIAWVEALEQRANLPAPAEDDYIMDDNQLRALAAAGHEIGSHSLTHPILTQCNERDLLIEMAEARERLGGVLGKAPAAFCYPNGSHDARVRVAAASAGYAWAATMDPGVNQAQGVDPMAVRRWFVQEERLQGPNGGQCARLMRLEWSGLADSLYRRGTAQ